MTATIVAAFAAANVACVAVATLVYGMPVPIALPVPVRLLHGMADPDVPWQHSLRLAAALEDGDVVTTLIKDGDHRLSRPQDLARLAAAIDELSQYPAASSAASPAR